MAGVTYDEYTIKLGPGGEQRLTVPAEQVRPMAATRDAFALAWGEAPSSYVTGRVGVSIPAGRPGEPVQTWRVRNDASEANTITLAFSERGVRDNRANALGAIRVKNEFQTALENDRVFTRDYGAVGVSGEYSHIELANPVGTGVLVQIVGLRIAANKQGYVSIRGGSDQSPLSNQGLTRAMRIQSGGVAATGQAVIRHETNSTKKQVDNAKRYGAFFVDPQAPVSSDLSFLIEPDAAIRISHAETEVNLEMGVQWVEAPI